MKNKIRYISLFKSYKNATAILRISICLFLLLFIHHTCSANKDPGYDEILIYVTVQGVGSMEMPAIIENEKIYLAVGVFFDFMKIRNNLSPGADSISGFLISPEAAFLIEKDHIVYGKKVFDLKSNDIIQTATTLYLRSDYFGQVFGLQCTFNFRSLSVMLTTRLELPVIREMRQDAARNNIRQLKGEVKADTTINSNSHLFHFGVADWSVVTTQGLKDIKGTQELNNTRFSLATGIALAGGEATVALNYDSYSSFSGKQQYYLWRMVNNDRRGVRQFMAGKISPQSASSIYSPVVGVQFTNTPTTYRRSFGTYKLSDRTEPNWMVELYVNNVLVNYVKADAAGFFTFDVPLVYGNSSVKLRFYGPWGEERITEQNINIPFNFLPQGQLEYMVSAGVVDDSLHSRFSRATFNYGLGKRVTIGAGLEYLSSVTSGKNMPFANASVRLASNLLLAGEYIYGVRWKDVLSYRLPSNLQIELSYTRYKKGQKAINNNFLEERRAVLSFPFRNKKLSLFSRFTFYQIVLPSSKYTNTEALFSGNIFGINTNLTTFALFNGKGQPYLYSNLSSAIRLPGKLVLTPQLQYEFNKNKFISMKGELGKPLSSHGFVNVFYENNFKIGYQSVGMGFRYDFSFAQIGFSARHGNHTTTLIQSASGSLLYNHETGYAGLSSRTSVGKGGIFIIPYLDLNNNGKRDKDEQKVSGLAVQINAGRIKYNAADTSFVVNNLEAYTSYIIRLNPDGFENITWQLKNKILNIEINPNQLQLVEVPVHVVGEVSGTVLMNKGGTQNGLGRITVSFYNSDLGLVAQTMTEADGFFSYTGFPPGSYTARIDPVQLNNLGLIAAPAEISFRILASKEGGVVDGLEFVLKDLVPLSKLITQP